MDISIETLQGFLEDAWDAAKDAANTLRPQLRGYESSVRALSSQGALGSVSKNSTSQSYRGPGLGSYTPIQIADAWRMLIQNYDQNLAKANAFQRLTVSDPTCQAAEWFAGLFPDFAADPDSAVYFFMKCDLQSVPSYQPDVSYLRLQATEYNGQFVQTW